MCDLSVERSIAHHVAPLDEPRSAIQRRHLLSEMIVIAIAASFSGADGWVGVETFGQTKEAWLRTFLKLPNGIPSHDTFGRVFALIDPAQFAACFRQWSASVAELIPDESIAVDGNTLRRSHHRSQGLAALHRVSTWATANRVVLGQVATDAKSNEITAIPRLLEWLKLEGCIVTIDALSRLKHDDTKLGIQNKRLKAGWDESYLSKLLFESPKRKGDQDASVTANISGA